MNSICEEMGPKLAALALDELDADEMAKVSRHVEGCGECQAELAELRATAGFLEARFAAEAIAPKLSAQRGAEIEAANVVAVPVAVEIPPARKRFGKEFWGAVGFVAAAAIALVILGPEQLERMPGSRGARRKADPGYLATAAEAYLVQVAPALRPPQEVKPAQVFVYPDALILNNIVSDDSKPDGQIKLSYATDEAVPMKLGEPRSSVEPAAVPRSMVQADPKQIDGAKTAMAEESGKSELSLSVRFPNLVDKSSYDPTDGTTHAGDIYRLRDGGGGPAPFPSAGGHSAPEVSVAITQSDLWRSLNDDQKKKVLNTMKLQDRARDGGDIAQRIAEPVKGGVKDEKLREIAAQASPPAASAPAATPPPSSPAQIIGALDATADIYRRSPAKEAQKPVRDLALAERVDQMNRAAMQPQAQLEVLERPARPARSSGSASERGGTLTEAEKVRSQTYYWSDPRAVASAPVAPPLTEPSIVPARPGRSLPNGGNVPDMFFQNYGVNPFVETAEDPLSTFSIDVDKASYTVARNYLNRGMLPPAEAIRVEEFINYFPSHYAPPKEETFAVYSEMTPSPFRPGYQILKIGVKGRELAAAERKPLVLTFVIDVSGSMGTENRLGLVKRTLHMLLAELKPSDKIGIAIFGTNGREYMQYDSASDSYSIGSAIDALHPEGSTNTEEGLVIGYGMARRAFDRDATNRVILCSDGVANVGNTSADSILNAVKENAGNDIYLTTLGFGMGNFNDVLMEQLADKGNGHYAYLDSEPEALKFIRKDLVGSMQVIAQDVKIQVAFNPAAIAKYRLLGYENRDIRDQDFRNDKVDAGEIGSGHAMTALYELKLAENGADNLAEFHLRFKQPEAGLAVKEIHGPIAKNEIAKEFAKTDDHFKLVAMASQAAELLRRSYWVRAFSMGDVIKLYDQTFKGSDPNTEAGEFRALMTQAAGLIPVAEPEPAGVTDRSAGGKQEEFMEDDSHFDGAKKLQVK